MTQGSAVLELNQPHQITVNLLKLWFVEEDVAVITRSLLILFRKKNDIITKNSFNLISKLAGGCR